VVAAFFDAQAAGQGRDVQDAAFLLDLNLLGGDLLGPAS